MVQAFIISVSKMWRENDTNTLKRTPKIPFVKLIHNKWCYIDVVEKGVTFLAYLVAYTTLNILHALNTRDITSDKNCFVVHSSRAGALNGTTVKEIRRNVQHEYTT